MRQVPWRPPADRKLEPKKKVRPDMPEITALHPKSLSERTNNHSILFSHSCMARLCVLKNLFIRSSLVIGGCGDQVSPMKKNHNSNKGHLQTLKNIHIKWIIKPDPSQENPLKKHLSQWNWQQKYNSDVRGKTEVLHLSSWWITGGGETRSLILKFEQPNPQGNTSQEANSLPLY